MSRRSHPSAALLASYARGAIPLAAGVTVAAHVDACRQCRALAHVAEEVEGAQLASINPRPLDPDALERVLAGLEFTDRAPPPAPDQRLGGIRPPEAVVRVGLGARRFLAPGLWAARLRAEPYDGWRTFLLRAPAGLSIPPHGHQGGELIAVLEGTFHDGRSYRAGDFVESVAGGDHRLRVAAEGPCVCLIAVQGRVQWRGWAKMITPILGI